MGRKRKRSREDSASSPSQEPPVASTGPTFRVGGVTFDVHLMILVLLGVMLPMAHQYRHVLFETRAYNQFLLFFLIPVATILLVFRTSPAQYGIRLGNWKEGLVWLACVCPVITVALWIVARDPAMKHLYSTFIAGGPGEVVWLSGVEMLAWEFLWRGFWLFGLARVFGPGPAILMQAVPFSLLHFGKPEVETITTMFGGFGFGFVAWRCQSFVYTWILHWYMLVAIVFIARYLV